MKKIWWKEATAYQVYPRSFMDSNGDGIGDIQGVINKLDYIKDLGIDVIWLSPVYQSPNDDNGYDISDYQAIMAEFGTMEDFDQLLAEVHQRGMKLIMDLVINHTSDEHPWFIESRSSRDNPYRDYYIWHKGKNGQEPNNWASIFGGSAWEYDAKTEAYYLHVFSRKQPDLNWENPEVRQSLYDMVNWWLDKGIDGFRVDAISHIKKKSGFPDVPNPENKKYAPSFAGHMNQEGIHTFLEELKQETFANYDIMTVGEANGVTIEDAHLWVGEEQGKFNMVFQFEHLDLWGKSISGGLDIHALKQILTKWQKGLEQKGWNALFLENHDQPRSVSTWGDDKAYWQESAKCLATLYFLMQGTPFIYQGQEIGMTNVQFDSIEDYNDVSIKNLYAEELENGKSHEEIMKIIWKNGRDNSRTPMQWSNHENAGFTTGTPWLKVNPNYKQINVEDQLADPNSIYHYYRKLVQLRKENDIFVYGRYDLILEDHNQIYAYTRTQANQQVLIITNLFAEETEFVLPETVKSRNGKLLLGNYARETADSINHIQLKPYEARVYELV
ncbi:MULTISPECIES: glycoside hydrolase family 13 protein [Virgibacillus]|uniref:Alpha-amylase n=1 Tax=Virgibacillus pantothenticus TaxID=1473 RepID=A0A0L0QTH0_VIRPA|nr:MULTISPECIES: alpha-glucosidase [Virgibacillus]API91167.1 glucohydrolase [Virgibacillus sp. 6R]KNE21879.1 oligo-1,6-glucosidase [Virgibacillus pantothenticus]MBS7429159.1 alpha-glucosidase [Virgibacillus sp. 19R1-5]MED3738058.1 alpha-glucosidase [Virgibacillus pantothenticus]QTY17123.1 alpha-glucosidase [Virgibacillus pantothenticus]